MVGDAHSGIPIFPEHLIEIRIAQLSGSHLDAYLALGGIGAGVEICLMHEDASLLAQLLAKLGVPERLFATEMEIAMCSFHAIAQCLHGAQQRHAVGSARECHQVGAFLLKHLVLGDEG